VKYQSFGDTGVDYFTALPEVILSSKDPIASAKCAIGTGTVEIIDRFNEGIKVLQRHVEEGIGVRTQKSPELLRRNLQVVQKAPVLQPASETECWGGGSVLTRH